MPKSSRSIYQRAKSAVRIHLLGKNDKYSFGNGSPDVPLPSQGLGVMAHDSQGSRTRKGSRTVGRRRSAGGRRSRKHKRRSRKH